MITIFFSGSLTKRTKSVISDYIQRSSLANPYGFKNELWKWAYLINLPKQTNKPKLVTSKSIQSRTIKPENEPTAYRNKADTRLEKDVSTWDISYNELLPFYVKAYQQRFLEWKQKDKDCTERTIPRRIPWLFPEDCTYITNLIL